MIPGNGSAEELVRIGKPAVPHLIPVLTQPDRNPSWLARKSICAVEILGAIGDTSATPAILEALEARRYDALFIEAAIKALGQLRDPRALPKLEQIAELSFQVSALYDQTAALGPGTPVEGFSEEAGRWGPAGDTDGVTFSLVGPVCYEAIAAIAPKESLATFRRSLGSRNKMERMAAILGLTKVPDHDKAVSRSVVRLLQDHLQVEGDAELQVMAVAVIHEARKCVSAAEKPGAIGDTSAAPAILQALEVKRRDAQFIEAAVEALGRLRDRRALPKLRQIAELSFQVAALSFRAAGVAPRAQVEGMSEEATWWSRNPGIDRVIFALLGFPCYEAMAAMDPKESLAIFRRSLASKNYWERLAAIVVLPKVPSYDKALSRSVLRLLVEHERVEVDGGLQMLTSGAIRDVRGVGR
jgi:HEAT repeat protein